MSQHLTNPERLRILEEYLSSDRSKYAIEKKYALSHGSLCYWLHKFGLEDTPQK